MSRGRLWASDVVNSVTTTAGKVVNIYTDSAYVAGAVHVELSQWKRAGFKTTTGTPIKHEKEMQELAEVLMRPKAVAVIKCKGHDKANTLIAKGNNEADRVAKQTAGFKPRVMMMQAGPSVTEMLPPCNVNMLIKEQAKASPCDISVWRERGAQKQNDL